MVDTDSSILAVVEDVLSKLDLKIKRLTAVDKGEHKNEIQFHKEDKRILDIFPSYLDTYGSE